MILNNLFSRRHKKEKNLFPDVFTYEPVPEKLKITLYKIFDRAFQFVESVAYSPMPLNFYRTIHDELCEEHSKHHLGETPPYNPSDYRKNVLTDFFSSNDVLFELDLINLACDSLFGAYQRYGRSNILEFITEINQRMLEHGFGYQYEDGLLIRIDSKHTHAEIVKPALSLLQDKRFQNADEEFRQAFDAYKAGNYEEAIRVANNSFETTMKIICELKKYGLPKKHNANALLEHLKLQNFVPDFHIEVFKKLANSLDSISVVRNAVAGHGQGHEKRVIEESMVSYVLNMTASTIKMLIELNNAK